MRPLLDRLDDEWLALAGTPSSRRRLRRWGREHPVLAGYGDLRELLTARLAGPEVAQELLLPLARLAPTDTLAARTLLQAVLPGIVRLATGPDRDDPRADEELVALAWVRIRTYPVTRCGSVAANILYDAQKEYRAHRAIEAPRSFTLGNDDDGTSPSAEARAMGRLALGDIVAAPQRGLMTDAGLRLVLRTRIGGTPLRSIADEEGVAVHVVVMRRWREVQRLRELELAG